MAPKQIAELAEIGRLGARARQPRFRQIERARERDRDKKISCYLVLSGATSGII